MPLQIDATDGGLRLAGELDMATADELLDADRSGLRSLLEASKLREGDGAIVILDPPKQVRRVLDISLPDGAPGLEVQSSEEEGAR